MKKNKARNPIMGREQCLRCGYMITELQTATCPRCRKRLNAGIGYQPRYCNNCGQKLSYAGIRWEPERIIRYTDRRDDG